MVGEEITTSHQLTFGSGWSTPIYVNGTVQSVSPVALTNGDQIVVNSETYAVGGGVVINGTSYQYSATLSIQGEDITVEYLTHQGPLMDSFTVTINYTA